MIVSDSTHLGRFARAHAAYIVAVIVIVVGVEVINDHIDFDRRALSPTSVGLVVTALSIFLAFRVGEAYARWWEARVLWGGIVNDSRSFARQVISLVSDEPARTRLVHRQIAWTHALRHALRREEDGESIDELLPERDRERVAAASNHPAQLMLEQAADLSRLQSAGALDPIARLALEDSMSRLTAHQGGCERIKNTAFPDRVAYFSRLTAWGLAIAIPCVVLESGNEIDLIDMFVTPFLMLAFLLTERLGAELKMPFENRINDTPMTAICRTIEIDLRQQLGERDVPAPLEPVDGVLM